ncbi:calpain-9-like isoform X1 [Watersipora subatra]|uniref:calpain-9-like isoform X1 n=1 Tax=Watersipora subatra TaxID=2589382 RepID=UPI00355B57BA
MTRTSRTVRTYRYVGPDGRELKRVETTTKTIDDDGTEKTEVQVTEDPGFPPEARPSGALPPGCWDMSGQSDATDQPTTQPDSGLSDDAFGSNFDSKFSHQDFPDRPMGFGLSGGSGWGFPGRDIDIGWRDSWDGGSSGGDSRRPFTNGDHKPLPSRGMSDRSMKIHNGLPVAEKKGAKSGWGQRESVVKPSIAVQGKNYDDIKAQCLAKGALWEDDEFPATDRSLFYSRRPNKKFEWKRPGEICDDPQLFVEGASRFDVQQGELGDCWLLAAVASLTCSKQLMHRIVPKQSFSDGYAGIFHFQFWQYGEWVDVVVDDRLPTYYNRLVFLHSKENNEFWSALLEKAYAKLHGSYEALKGGSQAEAMEDFTGGLTERFDLNNPPKNLLNIMLKGFQMGSLMGCALDAGGEIEGKGPMGLITGHAYSITSVNMVDIKTSRTEGKIPLVRVRNPWGNEAEWTGSWSDKSREWALISESQREELGLTFDDDGEFWMSYQDFCKYFTTLELCSLGPSSMSADDELAKNKWATKQESGQWMRRVNAGGCRNFLDTFWTNPQYHVVTIDPDDDDDDDLCTVIIGLMQKDRRKKREEGLDMLTIGYCIYKLKEPVSGNLDLNFFKYNASFAKSPTFINTREVCGRHKLPPGEYVIVPSTFSPNEEADFLLRIFSEKAADANSVDEDTGYDESKRTVSVPPADPAVVDKLRSTFEKISGDDMEVDAYELKDILNAAYGQDFKFDGFSLETCRSMVALMDYDHSGKLGFDEFQALWNSLREWKGVFKKYDADKSGYFNSYELRKALGASGFTLSNATFRCLVLRFANQKGEIEFDDFVLCAVRLKSMYDFYNNHLSNNTFNAAKDGSKASFALDEFVQNGIYS